MSRLKVGDRVDYVVSHLEGLTFNNTPGTIERALTRGGYRVAWDDGFKQERGEDPYNDDELILLSEKDNDQGN